MGGKKVSDKIEVITQLMDKADAQYAANIIATWAERYISPTEAKAAA